MKDNKSVSYQKYDLQEIEKKLCSKIQKPFVKIDERVLLLQAFQSYFSKKR